jgi:hypothetical protein
MDEPADAAGLKPPSVAYRPNRCATLNMRGHHPDTPILWPFNAADGWISAEWRFLQICLHEGACMRYPGF